MQNEEQITEEEIEKEIEAAILCGDMEIIGFNGTEPIIKLTEQGRKRVERQMQSGLN